MRTRWPIALCIAGLIHITGATAQDLKPFYASEKEIALGRSLADEIAAGTDPLDDISAVEFVQNMARQLERAANMEDELKVTVLDSADVESHAFPGGFLMVRSGLVVHSETAAELAGVLAHEIAHMVAKHGSRYALDLSSKDSFSVPLVFLGGWLGACARSATLDSIKPKGAVPMVWLKKARHYEEEADLLALEYLDRAGYAPEGLVQAYDRLTSDQTPDGLRMTTAVREKAKGYSSWGRTYVTSSSEFVEIRTRLGAGLPREQKPAPSLRRPNEP
jgi:predicted Zn-dependent protease